MRTRAKNYEDAPVPTPKPAQKKKATHKEAYLQPNTVPVPSILRTRHRRDPISSDFDLSDAFSKLSFSSSTAPVLPATMAEPTNFTPEWKGMRFRASIPGLVRGAGEALKPDGSKFRDWDFRIRRMVADYVSPDWLTSKECGEKDKEGDKVVRMMINYSVDTEIARKIEKTDTAFEALTTIRSLFYFPSRSKHVGAFKDLIAMKLSQGENLTEYLTTITGKFDELERDGFIFSKDSLLGLWFEIGLPPSFSNVTTTLNGILRAKPASAITSKQVEELVRSEDHQLSVAQPQEDILSLSNLSVQCQARPERFPSSVSPPSHWSRASNACRVWRQGTRGRSAYRPPGSNSTCRGCGGRGHYSYACPSNPRNQQTTLPSSSNSSSHRPPPSIPRANVTDVEGNAYEVRVQTPLPESFFMSEAYAGDHEESGDIGDTGVSHHVTGDGKAH